MSDVNWSLLNQRTLEGSLSTPSRVGGASTYAELPDKPSINGVPLEGDKSFEELGELTLTNSELKDLIDAQFDLIFGGS